MNEILSWLSEHSLLLSVIATASVIMMAVSLIAAPWIVSRLPSNYLQARLDRRPERNLWHTLKMLSRALLGFVIVLLGLIMLITPGPGFIMLLLGVSIAEFPGKNRLLVYLATRPNVLSSLNWMRKRHDKPPFIHPHDFD
ncbi:PGPGW domain-containing protein [Granulosicoccus antarcticus]|uniref:Transmembrane protein (PGPGW) n=1 Tax=Granulosicoccus antarcticus IMCC3135 TaxID=1192854 RepID=A0A2Z2P271_9GAMM|nr:PGPGW domain-containing protein [Granulosicoccus antarcticus]ASJ76691.1 hypothetical protein IMCC3135_33235 [Granulosicoccus antarcticus IMCC3135]